MLTGGLLADYPLVKKFWRFECELNRCCPGYRTGFPILVFLQICVFTRLIFFSK